MGTGDSWRQSVRFVTTLYGLAHSKCVDSIWGNTAELSHDLNVLHAKYVLLLIAHGADVGRTAQPGGSGQMFIRNTNQQNPRRRHDLFLRSRRIPPLPGLSSPLPLRWRRRHEKPTALDPLHSETRGKGLLFRRPHCAKQSAGPPPVSSHILKADRKRKEQRRM
ncbi:uncharacterized protein AB9W97_010342 isoform 1-T1 [Spinachia spinachia]